MKSSAEKIAMKSYADIFRPTSPEGQQANGGVTLPLDQLHPFKHHPFRLYNDEKMQEMVESIKQNGMLMPILVRPLKEGGFEIISGHNRVEAAKRAGLLDVPATIREMDDETAIIAMIDSNLRQREKLLPSEKAFAYKMKLDAIKRQGERTDLTSGQVVPKLADKPAREKVADIAGENYKQVSRYVRLTNLVPPLLEMVDENHLAFNPAVAISFLEVEQQFWLRELMERTQSTPSLAQAERMKLLSQRETLDFCAMETIMTEAKPQQNRLSIKSDKILKFFPGDFTPQQIEEVILKLVEHWYRRRLEEMEGR
jgi:ParB family chromosome partitioning protein